MSLLKQRTPGTRRRRSKKRIYTPGLGREFIRALWASMKLMFRRVKTAFMSLAPKTRTIALAGSGGVLAVLLLLIINPFAKKDTEQVDMPNSPIVLTSAQRPEVDDYETLNYLIDGMEHPESSTQMPDPTLKEGMENEQVQKLQERLMDLGYLDIDESTLKFGSATEYAVELFQRQHSLQQDGIAGPLTLEMIYSDEAKKYTLLEGTRGTDVDSFQRRLRELGYLDKVTGYYGTETIEAVKAFQKRNGLSVDGKAGEYTFDLIYSPKAKATAEKSKEERRKGNINKFLQAAKDQLGKKYVLGDEGPNTFDCSGLVTYCLRKAGSSTGRYSAAGFSQVDRWEKITSMSKLEKGDLLFFYNNARTKIGHVGIYIGGGEMIDASSSKGRVVRRSCRTSYWKKQFKLARRPW